MGALSDHRALFLRSSPGRIGFSGMNEVRFRSPVFPGDRLLVMAKVTRVRKGRRAEFDFQGYVSGKLVFSGNMIGVPISRDRNQAALDE